MYCRKKIHIKHVLQKKSSHKTCIIEKKFKQNMYYRKKVHTKHVLQKKVQTKHVEKKDDKENNYIVFPTQKS